MFGDTIEIRSRAVLESEYRARFEQDAYRGDTLLVKGVVEMVCLDGKKQVVPIPPSVVARVRG